MVPGVVFIYNFHCKLVWQHLMYFWSRTLVVIAAAISN